MTYSDTVFEAETVKRHAELNVRIEGLAYGGKGFARIDNFVIFVDRTIPGQHVTVRITKVKKNYAEARLLSIIEDSPDVEPPRCSYFGICGGCKYQNLKYDKQLLYKHQQVAETLEHIGNFSHISVQNMVPSPEIFFYRNKMEFSFSDNRWLTNEEVQSGQLTSEKDFALGLHIPGRHDKVLDVDHCFLLSERSNGVLNAVKDWAKSNGLKPYTTVTHSGYLRFLVLREGKNTDQFMINLVTADDGKKHKLIDALKEQLLAAFPFITTFVHNISRKKAQIAVGDEERILFGPGYIYERLNNFKYRISANSFLQTNSSQCEFLYEKISEWGNFNSNDIVYDLYCGAGTIAISIASMVKKVVGIELVPQAIEDAVVNCETNSVKNCEFIQGDLRANISDPGMLMNHYGKPDTVIIDPPRSGMHPDIPGKIVELGPEKIIYISCNPATLSRDLKQLCENSYTLDNVLPVDMFPHTAHCEVITLLTKKG